MRLPDGVRPAIIPAELWEACQHNIRARAARMNNKGGRPALLRGHIFCAACGRSMIRNHFRRGKYEYLKYRCGSRWRPYETECRGEGVPFEAVHEWAWGRVKALLSSPGFFERALAGAGLDVQTAQLASDMNAARRMRERYWLSPAREARRLDGLITELEARLAEARQPAERLRQLRDLCEGARGQLDSLAPEERRLAFRATGFTVFANGADSAGWRYKVGTTGATVAQRGRS